LRVLFRIFFGAIWLLVLTSRADAAPVRCSYGYQDSSCVTPLSHAPIPQPQCPAAAGWTTTSAAVWQGAQWSAPACNFQAAPTCPNGYTEISSPSWNGSSWVGLGCQPNSPVPLSGPSFAQCIAAFDPLYRIRSVPEQGISTAQFERGYVILKSSIAGPTFGIRTGQITSSSTSYGLVCYYDPNTYAFVGAIAQGESPYSPQLFGSGPWVAGTGSHLYWPCGGYPIVPAFDRNTAMSMISESECGWSQMDQPTPPMFFGP